MFQFQRSERRLWWQWIVVSAVSWFVFMALSRSVLFWVGALVIGTGQWLVLRGRIKGAAWWLLATPAGLLFGAIIGGVFGGVVQDAIDGVRTTRLGIHSVVPGRGVGAYLVAEGLASLCFGLVLATSQWLVLRVATERTVWWLSCSGLSIAVGFVLNDLIGGSALNQIVPLVMLVQMLGALLIATGTGVGLLRSLRPSGPAQEDAT